MSLPDARPLVVDEAYFEYCGRDRGAAARRRRDRAAHLLEALRARGARIGYALAAPDARPS